MTGAPAPEADALVAKYVALHIEIVRRQQDGLRLHAEREGLWRQMTAEQQSAANRWINAERERGSKGAAQRPWWTER